MPTVLIDPGSYNCLNFGDFAMLQVAIARWTALWPAASLEVLTDAPKALATFGPRVTPLDVHARSIWLQTHAVGRLHGLLPRRAAATLEAGERRLKLAAARPLEAALTFKRRLAGEAVSSVAAFLRSIRSADVVMLSGAGIMNDAFFHSASAILDTLEIASCRTRGRPVTAILGQGFGPLVDPALRSKAAAVLPRLDLIAIRERRASWPLLRELGVSGDRIVVTGDDAIELAYEQRKTEIGRGLGVNVRVAYYAQTDASVLGSVKDVLHTAARRYDAPLVPLPISRQDGGIDAAAIRELLTGYVEHSDGGASLQSPAAVISEVARCRVVVTGSYHAAVFALAQGIPSIGLVRSQYYRDKFLGLADQFGGGVEVLGLDRADFGVELDAAIDRAWNSAERVRPMLLAAASRQIELSWSAYRTVAELASAKQPPALNVGKASSASTMQRS
jgi:colanic acid/amylovoran biosynthesis protein